jgi:NADPH2:quinone reductase
MTTKTMNAWQVTAWGEPESMQWNEIAVPAPKAGQILIQVRAAALNFFDILQIQGKYQVKPPFPFTPGAEVSGVVETVGEDVQGFAPGDHVLAMVNQGGFAECALSDPHRTFHVPKGMDFPAAAAFPIVYQTSYFALVTRGQLQAGEWLLVHAGASGVGMSAIQIGKALGAHVIATAGSEDKLQFAREQGADHVVSYSEPGWVDAVKSFTKGRGADVIYDPVGGDIFDLSSKCIASEGRHLVIGFASGRIASLAANRALLKNMSLMGVFWGGYVHEHPGYVAECQAALEQLAEEGKIHPRVAKSYEMRDAPQALRDMANRKVIGKTVLLP